MAATNLTDVSHQVLEALLRLRPAGDRSFERLVADLLADLTEIPFRLSRAGDQDGVDALSADDVGLEVKRYEPERKLEERPLLGELDQAAQANPDLQVWILATTQEVPVQLARKLKWKARALGLGLVILDRAAAHPLPVPAIVALAAASPDRSLAALVEEAWWDTKKDAPPPARDVARALDAVRLHQAFETWKARVRREVQGLPIWDRLRREQNLRLKRRIQEHAEEFFGTGFDLDAAVPREVETKISEWYETVERVEKPSVGVVLGERYDGKTWCVYHWLVENLDELRMPVFFFGAKQADGSQPAVKELIVREIADILSVDAQQARRLFERFSCLEAGEGPWGLVILDGLNEYRVDPERPFQHLAHTAAQLTDLNHRPCAVLATTRTQWWQEQQTRIKQSTTLFEIGPYSDAELRVALAKWHEDLSVLETVQESARPLIRRPRYLQLVLDNRDRLNQFGAVTADVLHYLDAIDKMRDHGYMAAGTRWDHQAYSETLSALARSFLQESRLCSLWQRRDINRIVADLVSDPQAALRDLESEGVLALVEGGYRVSPQRLVTGMGLWLPEALRAAKRSGENVNAEPRTWPPSLEASSGAAKVW